MAYSDFAPKDDNHHHVLVHGEHGSLDDHECQRTRLSCDEEGMAQGLHGRNGIQLLHAQPSGMRRDANLA